MFTGRIKKITSSENNNLKVWSRLHEKKFRKRNGSCLLFGEKIISELAPSVHIRSLLFTKNGQEAAKKLIAENYFLISENLFKKISHLPAPPLLAAEIEIPAPSSLSNFNFLLVLDRLSDPGNLGTIIRTALAFGWQGLFLLDGSCDLYHDKTLAASRGASLLLPYCYGDFESLSSLLKKEKIPLLVADLKGESLSPSHRKKRLALLLGNESLGVSDRAKREGLAIKIPMTKEMEALNVAIAASIFMYELGKNDPF